MDRLEEDSVTMEGVVRVPPAWTVTVPADSEKADESAMYVRCWVTVHRPPAREPTEAGGMDSSVGPGNVWSGHVPSNMVTRLGTMMTELASAVSWATDTTVVLVPPEGAWPSHCKLAIRLPISISSYVVHNIPE
jgi:hypothetical protein